jgi:2-dehydropantoate 2-reductase
MKYAIMGAGSFGQRYGAPLAIAGHDVTFIARTATLENLKTNGVHLAESVTTGALDIDSVKATDNPETVGEVDVVIVAVKTYQLDEAAHARFCQNSALPANFSRPKYMIDPCI